MGGSGSTLKGGGAEAAAGGGGGGGGSVGGSGRRFSQRASSLLSPSSPPPPPPPPEISEQQKQLLTDAWKTLEDDIASVGVITFISLFETHPDVQQVFMPFNGIAIEDLKHSKQLRAHALRVMAFVQKAVARLYEPEEKLLTLLQDLGRKHVSYGAKQEYVDVVVYGLAIFSLSLFDGDCAPAQSQQMAAGRLYKYYSGSASLMAHQYHYFYKDCSGSAPLVAQHYPNLYQDYSGSTL